MLRRNQILEDGRVPANEAKHRKIEGPKRRITRKEYQRLLNKFDMEGFMAQKGLWKLARDKALQDRGALPREEGDAVIQCKAMHEENILSSWLRDDGKSKTNEDEEVRENVG